MKFGRTENNDTGFISSLLPAVAVLCVVTALPVSWGKETFAEDGFRHPLEQNQARLLFYIKALRFGKV